MNTLPNGFRKLARPGSSRTSLLDELSSLSPELFGMVMATGIISLAAYQQGAPNIAQALFWLNIVACIVIWGLSGVRMVRSPRCFFGEMVGHLRGPAFFTSVAGTSILGCQFMMLAGNYHAGAMLWVLAIVLWSILVYAIFGGIITRKHKPSLNLGISGAWLLAVVATQSVAVSGALLAARGSPPAGPETNFLALVMWCLGGMFYIWIISLIFYRLAFVRLASAELSPSYWVNMGAMAISTLAGSLLITNARVSPFLFSLLPFVKGFTLFYWAAGTWWIPLLVVLTVWRHFYARFPLKYEPSYWSMVFPLGMYAASTYAMIDAMGLEFLGFLPPVFFYFGFAAWVLTLVGFAFDLARRLQGV